MPGVRIPKIDDEDIEKRLKYDLIANLSFLMGVPYPLPLWYSKLSTLQKTLWMLYARFGDLMTFLLFLSNIIELFLAYRDIRAFVTCIGTLTYIICFRIKIYVYTSKAKKLEKVLESLYKISQNLDKNPMKNDQFFTIYDKHFNEILFLSKGKIGATAGGVCTLAIYEMIHGYLQDSDTKRNLPMFGWYPYDAYQLKYFEISCLFQLVSYLSFLLKDVVVDLLLLTVLVTFNSHLIHLRILLGELIQQNENEYKLVIPEDKRDLLTWWIKHHQKVLNTIDDFKEITSPYLFYKYISVSIILFFGGVLVTSNIEYDLVQQMIVLAINSSNLLQLYIISIVGDKIAENSLRLTEMGLHVNVIVSNKIVRSSYLFITMKCTRPILINFGQINPLSVASFGQIVRLIFSYFLTIVQIRDKALEAHESASQLKNTTDIN